MAGGIWDEILLKKFRLLISVSTENSTEIAKKNAKYKNPRNTLLKTTDQAPKPQFGSHNLTQFWGKKAL
jgi:hypothetical protein